MLTAASASAEGRPDYIFYFIGDGMGMNHVINSMIYNREVLGADTTLRMLTLPVTTFCTTRSVTSDVTDSAAAGTALATGVKTRNSMLGMGPDTTAVESVASRLFSRGWGVGLATTVGIDDATPGAFYAHVPNRHERMTVGRQLAESGYQFAAGAGLAAARDKEGHQTGLLDYFAEQGVTVAYGPEGLQTEADRLLVLSTDTAMTWNVGYAVDSVAGALTLADMTAAGIRQLQRVSPERFFFMIEGGSIDHGGHANDGGTIVREVLAFDRAIAVAYQFYLAHPDKTLIVITADHETGGMSVGTTTTGYNVYPRVVSRQKISKEMFSEYVKGLLLDSEEHSWEEMERFIRENLGLGDSFTLTEEETDELSRMFVSMIEGRADIPDEETLYATFDGFSSHLFRLLNDKAGMGFTTIKHTGAPVPVFAIGAGSGHIGGLVDNTDLPRLILEAATGGK